MTYPVKLEECSWPVIQAALDDGYETVIIPAGSVEQHGPHLPILTDALIGEAMAVSIAEKLGQSFAAPVIRPGLSAHHMAFPGSFTLSPATFTGLLEETCLSLACHGFRNLVLISSHGGNIAAIAEAVDRIQEKIWDAGLPARVMPLLELESVDSTLDALLTQEYGRDSSEALGHADVLETAIMLALRPDLVDMSRAVSGWMGSWKDTQLDLARDGIHAFSPVGILGDPRAATAEMGARLFDTMTGLMAEELRVQLRCRR